MLYILVAYLITQYGLNMSETTNRTIGDTNPLIPRVVEKGEVTFGDFAAYGTHYKATATATLNNILASSNPIIDCYFAQTADGTDYEIYKMDYLSVFTNGLPAITANHYLDTTTYNGKTVVRLNFETTNYFLTGYIYKAYYVIYSASFTDEVVF